MGHLWLRQLKGRWVGHLLQMGGIVTILEGYIYISHLQLSTLSDHCVTADFGSFELPTQMVITVLKFSS